MKSRVLQRGWLVLCTLAFLWAGNSRAEVRWTLHVGHTIERTHLVNALETLAHIASKYGMTIQRLKDLNGMKSGRIIAGQRVNVLATGSETQATTALPRLPHRLRFGPWSCRISGATDYRPDRAHPSHNPDLPQLKQYAILERSIECHIPPTDGRAVLVTARLVVRNPEVAAVTSTAIVLRAADSTWTATINGVFVPQAR